MSELTEQQGQSGFGEWVRNIRRGRRWTETECAHRAGVSLQRWNRWEKRVGHPQRKTCEIIAQGLELPVEEVLTAAGYAVGAAGSVEDRTDLCRRLERVLKPLPPQARTKAEEELVRDAQQYVNLLRESSDP